MLRLAVIVLIASAPTTAAYYSSKSVQSSVVAPPGNAGGGAVHSPKSASNVYAKVDATPVEGLVADAVVSYGFAPNIIACPGDVVDVHWTGYHNIQEVAGSACSSGEIGAQVIDYQNAYYKVRYSADELSAQPGETRYFKCGLHCGETNARFEVSCPGPAAVAETACADSTTSCVGWASSGECDANPTWMNANCQLSCGQCTPSPVTEAAAAVTAAPTAAAVAETACADSTTSCFGWASFGECGANPTWMLANCQQSCGSCAETNGLLRKGQGPAEGNDEEGKATKRPKTTDEENKKMEKGSKKGKQAWKGKSTKHFKQAWKGKGNRKVKSTKEAAPSN